MEKYKGKVGKDLIYNSENKYKEARNKPYVKEKSEILEESQGWGIIRSKRKNVLRREFRTVSKAGESSSKIGLKYKYWIARKIIVPLVKLLYEGKHRILRKHIKYLPDKKI